MLVKRTWNPGTLACTTSHPGACCKSVDLLLVDSIYYLFSIKHHLYHGFLPCNTLWWLPMEQWVSPCGSWTSSISTIWKVVRNVNLGTLPQICWILTLLVGLIGVFINPDAQLFNLAFRTFFPLQSYNCLLYLVLLVLPGIIFFFYFYVIWSHLQSCKFLEVSVPVFFRLTNL